MTIVEKFTNQFLNNEEDSEVEGAIYTGINYTHMFKTTIYLYYSINLAKSNA